MSAHASPLASRLLLVTLVCGLAAAPAEGRQLAMVVGINHYLHGGEDAAAAPRNLQGAVNDAELIATALRANGVALPDDRVLLDSAATRAAFLAAWRRMTAAAEAGDTLILTYAGHGGQEWEIAPPMDEADDKDETLMLYDFDPRIPTQGRLTDDELYGLFSQVPDNPILFVADSCHAAGLSRGLRAPKSSRSRFGRDWNITLDMPPPPSSAPAIAEEGADLRHLTLIAATKNEALSMDETVFGTTPHGALSWYFAKALGGEADRDGGSTLTRAELKDYLVTRVSTHMDSRQTPRLLPRGDATPVLRLKPDADTDPAPVVEGTPLPIRVEGGKPPAGLRGVRIADPYRLLLRIHGKRTEVSSGNGDILADIATERGAWQAVIDREHLLSALDEAYTRRLHPLRITLAEGDEVHHRGGSLHFTIAPGTAADELDALSLFNLPGDGRVQFLYPLEAFRDRQVVSRYPYRVPPIKVSSPFGGDTLVAILCRRVPVALHKLLQSYDGQPAPQAVALIDALDGNECQIGRYSVFTAP